MKQLKIYLAGLMLIAAFHTYAQDAKRHLRDFTPRYKIDSFLVDGEPSAIKRKVINLQELKGIKSAYWDEDSHLFIVQFDEKLIKAAAIKTSLIPGNPASATTASSLAKHTPVKPIKSFIPFQPLLNKITTNKILSKSLRNCCY